MKTRAVLFALACVVAATSGFVAWWQWKTAALQKDRCQPLLAERSRLEENLRTAKARLAESSVPQNAETTVPRNPTENVPAGSTPPKTPRADPYAFIASDPEIQRLRIAWQRVENVKTYGAFTLRRKLSPTQIEAFQALLDRKSADREDLRAIRLAQGLASDDKALAAEGSRLEAEVRAELSVLLGESGFSAFLDYERALEVRKYVNRLSGAMSVAGVPLSLDQADALTLALAGTHDRFSMGGKASLGRTDGKAAEKLVQPILTPQQIRIYREDRPLQGESRTGAELSRAVFRALGETKPR